MCCSRAIVGAGAECDRDADLTTCFVRGRYRRFRKRLRWWRPILHPGGSRGRIAVRSSSADTSGRNKWYSDSPDDPTC